MKSEVPFHPAVNGGYGVLPVHPKGSLFYPRRALYHARKRVETTSAFRTLIRPLLGKTLRTRPVHFTIYVFKKPTTPPGIRYLATGKPHDAAHVIEMLLREPEEHLFPTHARIYVETLPGLWLAIRYIRKTEKWRLHAMTDDEFLRAEPLGTIVLN